MKHRIRAIACSAGTFLVLGACATAPRQTAAASASGSMGPGDFNVVNPTTCYARMLSVGAGSAGGNVFVNDSQELAMLAPGQKATVSVPANRRLSVVTYTTPNPEPGQPGADCRRSGTVTWTRVAGGS